MFGTAQVWDWDIRRPLMASTADAPGQGVPHLCSILAEAVSVSLAAAWERGQRSFVQAMLLLPDASMGSRCGTLGFGRGKECGRQGQCQWKSMRPHKLAGCGVDCRRAAGCLDGFIPPALRFTPAHRNRPSPLSSRPFCQSPAAGPTQRRAAGRGAAHRPHLHARGVQPGVLSAGARWAAGRSYPDKGGAGLNARMHRPGAFRRARAGKGCEKECRCRCRPIQLKLRGESYHRLGGGATYDSVGELLRQLWLGSVRQRWRRLRRRASTGR
eukprot:362180-Chlamydomonas_euryale.AAC.4